MAKPVKLEKFAAWVRDDHIEIMIGDPRVKPIRLTIEFKLLPALICALANMARQIDPAKAQGMDQTATGLRTLQPTGVAPEVWDGFPVLRCDFGPMQLALGITSEHLKSVVQLFDSLPKQNLN